MVGHKKKCDFLMSPHTAWEKTIITPSRLALLDSELVQSLTGCDDGFFPC